MMVEMRFFAQVYNFRIIADCRHVEFLVEVGQICHVVTYLLRPYDAVSFPFPSIVLSV